jgi:hypothetical protein
MALSTASAALREELLGWAARREAAEAQREAASLPSADASSCSSATMRERQACSVGMADGEGLAQISTESTDSSCQRRAREHCKSGHLLSAT